jgi:isopenicillin N synthase-like dioxygenase
VCAASDFTFIFSISPYYTYTPTAAAMASFTEVPILDLSLAQDPETKPQFLEDLKKALLEVGFLYIKNTGVDEELVKDVVRLTKEFFELPMDEKLRLEMKNCLPLSPSPHAPFRDVANSSRAKAPHFLGYSRLGNEMYVWW